tara:strand:+ start:669 stop:905 length:237 start_codon:yes stop_codon:yes gene_type:complete
MDKSALCRLTLHSSANRFGRELSPSQMVCSKDIIFNLLFLCLLILIFSVLSRICIFKISDVLDSHVRCSCTKATFKPD